MSESIFNTTRHYIDNVIGLSSNDKSNLKQLINQGIIIPEAVLGAKIVFLKEFY